LFCWVPLTLIMIGAGTLIGFWVPFRRHEVVERAEPVDEISPDETTKV